ncbi:MAG: universal stress protein [Vicinamibacterales bacterium]
MRPPRSILAAVDFSEQSRQALTLAARLARQCGAALHVLHAEDPLLAAAATQAGIDLTAETQEELQRFIGSAPPAATCTPSRSVVMGAPVSTILHVAKRDGDDLIVLGAHGMSGAGHALFGSVTEGVLTRADRSVLVTPDGWSAPRPDVGGLAGVGPIVVGIDFSHSSLRAARSACALAECMQTSVEAVHVVADLPVLERWRPHAERIMAERTEIARRDLAGLMDTLAPRVRVTTRVETGQVADRLAESVAPIGTRHPWLVLGRRSSPAHLGAPGAPGAVAYRAARIARVPVLMHVNQEGGE